MDRFTVEVPWGISRIESSGSGVDIPEVDPVEALVGANEQCVVMSVIHGDVGLVAVDVEFGVGDDRGILVYEGTLQVGDSGVEIADVVGDDFCRKYPIEGE